MGFSVSSATVVILLGLLIGFGMFYSVADASVTRVVDAHDDRADRLLDVKNTQITPIEAGYNTSSNQVTGTVRNDGTTSIPISKTSVLIDGEYDTGLDLEVENAPDSHIWMPGEKLRFESGSYDSAPESIKVVTPDGVSASTPVETIDMEDG